MFCPNCGTKLEENVAFCTSCGAAIASEGLPQPEQVSFPDPTVLPTPEGGRIDPRQITPAPQQEQEIDLDSIVSSISDPEPETDGFAQNFTDEDMAWFTDHQSRPAQTTYPKPQQPSYPQQPTYPQQQPTYPQPTNPSQAAQPQPIPGNPYFVPPVPVDLTPRKSNFLLGFIGALVFSLIGCVIWVLIGSLGFISYLGALAMSFLVITGYKLLGKRFDMTGLLVSLLVVAAAVFASNVFIHAMELSDGLDEMKEAILEEAAAGDYGVSEEYVEEVLSLLGLNHTGVIDVFLHFFNYADTIDNLNDYAGGYSTGSILDTFWLNLGLSYLFAGVAFLVVAIPQYKASN